MARLICVECSLNFIGTLTLLSRVWVLIPTPGMRDSGCSAISLVDRVLTQTSVPSIAG